MAESYRPSSIPSPSETASEMEKEETAQLPENQALTEMVVKWYFIGMRCMEAGMPYHPPNDGYLRIAFSLGWADSIMGVISSEEDVVKQVMG